jgi:predicted Zn-dependent protease
VGIRTLSRAGYDIDAMAGFFSKLQQATRVARGSGREAVPDYLQTHPVTTTRISEARQRADQLRGDQVTTVTAVPGGGERVERFDRRGITLPETRSANPLLPVPVTLPSLAFGQGGTGDFSWARERLRALSADTPSAAVREYETLRRQTGKPLDGPQRYGLAIAHLQGGDVRTALTELRKLENDHPDSLWVSLTLGEAESRTGDTAAANRRFDALVQRLPQNRPVALTYAKVLNEQGGADAGRRAQAVLRPLMARAGDDPVFQQQFARANELAGDTARAGEAYAEAAYLNGRPEQALIQLQNLKKQSNLDYYARARVDARIAAITPEVLELRRQGIRDPDVERR